MYSFLTQTKELIWNGLHIVVPDALKNDKTGH